MKNAKHSEEVCTGEVLHGMYGCCKQTVCEGSSCAQLCSYVHTELKFYQYKTLGNHQHSAVEKVILTHSQALSRGSLGMSLPHITTQYSCTTTAD